MNVLQKIILGAGLLVLGIIVLFPHWTLSHPTEPNLVNDGGHTFMFSPPRGVMIPHINFLELVVFSLAIVALTGAAYWLTRDRE